MPQASVKNPRELPCGEQRRMSTRAERGAMGHVEGESRPRNIVPAGIGIGEAKLLLQLFAQLKARRFGRLEVTVSDGRVTDVQLVEKLDRELLRRF